jgi:O-methyltransferase
MLGHLCSAGMNKRDESLFVTRPSDDAPMEECLFYHVMDLPGYSDPTPGYWDLRGDFPAYIGNVDLRGKSVLDIGCASGFLSMSAEQAGAREVVSFDMDRGDRQTLLPHKDSLYYRDYPAWVTENTAFIKKWHNAYWRTHHAFNSKARCFHGDVYRLPDGLGRFDVVLLCAVLEHLADPIAAMASIARHVEEHLVLSVWVPDQAQEQPIAWFLGAANRTDEQANFWAYSIPVYREVLGMLDFEIESVLSADFKLASGATSPRTAIIARRISRDPTHGSDPRLMPLRD